MSTIKIIRFFFASLMWALAVTCVSVGSAQPTQQEPKSEQDGAASNANQSESETPAPTTQKSVTPLKQEPISSDSKTWTLFEPAESRASFRMPVKPSFKQRMYTPVEGQPPIKIHNYLGVFNNDKGLFLFNYHDLNQVPLDSAIEEIFKMAMLESISRVGGRLIKEELIRYRKNPGRMFEFRFAKNDVFYKGIARIFLIGKRQYQVAVIMEEASFDQKICNSFLNSLTLTEPEAEPKDAADSKKTDSIEEETKLTESESEQGDAEPDLQLPLDDDGTLQ
jgi:hypothetical protein